MTAIFEDTVDAKKVHHGNHDIIGGALDGGRTGIKSRESVQYRTDTDIMCTQADEEECVPFMYDDADDSSGLPPIAQSSFHSPLAVHSSPYSEPFTASKMRVLTPGNFYLYLPQLGLQTDTPSRNDVVNSCHGASTERVHSAVSGSLTGSTTGPGSNITGRGDNRDTGEEPRIDPYIPAVPTPMTTPLPASRFSPRKIYPLPPKRIYAEDVTVQALGYGWRHIACEEHCKAFLQLLSSCRCVCFELLYRRVPTVRFHGGDSQGLGRQFAGKTASYG